MLLNIEQEVKLCQRRRGENQPFTLELKQSSITGTRTLSQL